MQALCGRIRTLRRHAIESSNVYAFNSIRGGSVSGAPLLTSLDSKSLYLNGVVATNSHGHLLRLLPEFSSNSTLVVHKKFGSRLESLSQSRNNHTASIAPFSRDATTAFQLATMVPIFPRRCISTNVNSAESISEDTSPSASDVPPRIKFKRLDKTARHIMQILNKEAVEEMKTQREIPDIRPGYIIQLKVEVPENKRRVSIVKGIVIARRNAGPNTTFRLRRLVAGVGVESLFPLYSPNIKEIKVLDKKKVRRAKLYYLRDKMNALKK